MSISLDSDKARRFVGPDMGPNCLPIITKTCPCNIQRFFAAIKMIFLNENF